MIAFRITFAQDPSHDLSSTLYVSIDYLSNYVTTMAKRRYFHEPFADMSIILENYDAFALTVDDLFVIQSEVLLTLNVTR